MPVISVNGRDDKVTAREKAHAEEKLGKLARYYDGIVKMEAFLGHGPNDAEAELVVSVPGGKKLVNHAKGRDLFAAVDVLIDKAETQLTRHKEKLKAHKGGQRTEDFAAGAELPAEES